LRPQLLDRFGMHAEIRTVRDPETRVRVVEERSNFDQNPDECLTENADALKALREKIVDAQNLLPDVELDFELRVKISQVCGSLDVDGLRGDIVTNRASKAYAAYNGRNKVTVEDIENVITLCLRHRLRKDPLESIDSGDKVQGVFEEVFK
jgi:magnesium chelatase subunit I